MNLALPRLAVICCDETQASCSCHQLWAASFGTRRALVTIIRGTLVGSFDMALPGEWSGDASAPRLQASQLFAAVPVFLETTADVAKAALLSQLSEI